MPRFPGRSPFVQQLSDGVFSQLAARARTQHGPLYPLHIGDTYLEPPAVGTAEQQRTAGFAGLHKYAPVQGEPRLLQAAADRVAHRSGMQLEAENLQVMAGVTAGLTVVCSTLLSPGDEVVLPSPYWPLIRGIIQARGAIPVEVPLFDRLDQPGFDPSAALAAAVTDRTVALYLNTPNNPTGQCLSPQQMDAIGELAQQHDLWILCDEVYEELYLGGAPPVSAFTRPAFVGRTVACHSLSKAFALAGARVGYTHGPADLMEAVRGVQTFTTYCAARPMQLGAARVLEDAEPWLERIRALYTEAAQAAARALDLPVPAAGTFLFFPSDPYRRAGETTLGFLERCLDAGVMLTPGGASGKDFQDWVRLCFTCVPPAELEEALTRLQRVLRS